MEKYFKIKSGTHGFDDTNICIALGYRYPQLVFEVEEVPDQQAEIDRLRGALRLYAITVKWEEDDDIGMGICMFCHGSWPNDEAEEHELDDETGKPCPCEVKSE